MNQKILLSLVVFITLASSQDTTIVIFGDSPFFTIDTQAPIIEWLSPDDGEVFESGEIITGEWSASDSLFGGTPIQVYMAASIGDYFTALSENLANDGVADMQLPEVNTSYARIKVIAVDYFGNSGEDFGDGYFTIGAPGSGWGQDSTLVLFGESMGFIIDTDNPTVTLSAPNDGESFEHNELITVQWSADDDSFDDTAISFFLSPGIGETFDPFAIELENNGLITIPAPDLNTAYARLKIIATDIFGNYALDTSDGYFIIGNPGMGWGQDSTLVLQNESSDFIVDTVIPVVSLVSPNGGEVFNVGDDIPLQWSAVDDSFSDTAISFYLSPTIGGFFESFLMDQENTGSAVQSAPNLTTGYALMRVTAIDNFGNSASDNSDGYFAIGDSTGFAIDDTTLVIDDQSESMTVDTKFPVVDLISPNGGEHFDSGETVTVDWAAEDDSFTDEAIDILITTEIGGYFIPLAQNLPNSFSYDVSLPESDMAFVRLKLTATDNFGNSTSDYGDDYFILGDPFGDFDANEVYDFVVLNWGWGLYQLVVIRSDALTFLEPGDEIHIVDEQGIMEEGCPEAPGEGIGSVSVASVVYQPQPDSLYAFSCTGSVDLCDLDGPRLPGYVDGNTIHYFIFDASADTVYEIIPESYEFGEGLFGEPVSVVNAFNQNSLTVSNPSGLYVNASRTEPDFSYHVFRNGESLLTDYSMNYYLDQDVTTGTNYCYVIDLIDGNGSVMLTSDETCIIFGADNIIPGDITQDQIVNVLDVVLIVDYILNNTTPTETELTASDLNGDSVLDVVDLVLLVDLILYQ